MKKMTVVIIIISIILVGCSDDNFRVNLFGFFDNYKLIVDPTDTQQILNLVDDDDFYTSLTDEEKKIALNTANDAILSAVPEGLVEIKDGKVVIVGSYEDLEKAMGSMTPEQISQLQKASLLSANLSLDISGATQTLSNANGMVMDAMDNLDNFDTYVNESLGSEQAVYSTLLGADPDGDYTEGEKEAMKDSFITQIDAMQSSSSALTLYGATLSQEPEPDVEYETAQKAGTQALVAGTVNMMTNEEAGNSPEELADYVVDVATTGESDTTMVMPDAEGDLSNSAGEGLGNVMENTGVDGLVDTAAATGGI